MIPWTAARQASPSTINSQNLLKLMSIESVMPPNHLILCRPLLPLPSIFPSIRVFSNELVLHIRGPKYWSFAFTSVSRAWPSRFHWERATAELRVRKPRDSALCCSSFDRNLHPFLVTTSTMTTAAFPEVCESFQGIFKPEGSLGNPPNLHLSSEMSEVLWRGRVL